MAKYQAQKSDRITFGLWTIQNTGRDPFGDATRASMTGLEVIKELGKRPIWAYEMHAEDLVPDGTPLAEQDRILREANKMMKDLDIQCVNCGSNVFGHPAFKDGSITSHDPKVRHYALQKYLRAIDIGYAVNSRLCNLWWGRDGAEVDSAKCPMEAFKRLRDGLNYLQSYIDEQGYKGHRLGIEPKPNEPRGDIYLPTAGHALALISTLNRPENCGVVVEIAHARMAGLNAYHEIALPLESGKLLSVHLNGQKPLRFDQDLRFGAEDLKESFLVIKLLEDAKYTGPISFDAHTYRTSDREEVWDFVEGCTRMYLILKERVQRFNTDPEIQGILKELHEGGKDTPPAAAELKKMTFDLDALGRRKLHHEKLDQLTQELLLGVR